MGAGASVDFSFPQDSTGDNLELQAAANWHRIIKHANNGGAEAGAEAKVDLSSPHISVSRAHQSLFQVFTPGSTAPYSFPQEEISPDHNIFRTSHREDLTTSKRQEVWKEESQLYQQCERLPVQMRLSRRSGSTVVIEWDGEKELQAMHRSLDCADRIEPVRYEVIVGLGQGPLLHWELLYSGQLSPP